MYQPSQSAIAEKANELLIEKIQELDAFKTPLIVEAIGNDNGELASVLIEFAKADTQDDKLYCHDKFLKALHAYFKIDAENVLIAEVGYFKQTAVDDFKFIHHAD